MQKGLSINVNIHREGYLLKSCLESVFQNLEKSEELSKKNLLYEINLILDDSDNITKNICKSYANRKNVNTYDLKTNDLGFNKNFAVEVSNFEIVAFIDGDDIWGLNWLQKSVPMLKQKSTSILHPELIIYFGEKTEFFICKNINFVNKDKIKIENNWISSILTRKSILKEFKFKNKLELEKGDFEDWEWNRKTLNKGIIHKVVPNTIHFVRVKEQSYSREVIDGWK